ncbi:MAG: GNAT family N-acetyltransferase [Mycobacteriales bacterium]
MTPVPEEVTTARLRLQPLRPDTARAVLAGELECVDPAPGWPHADSLVVVRAALELGWPTWLILKSARVIGECGLKGWPDAGGVVEVGYGLAEPARRHGYGREAVSGLLDWLARRGYAREVLAEVAAGNTASRRLVGALGFVETSVSNGFVYYRKRLLTPE